MAAPISPSETLVMPVNIPNRGRALVAIRDIRAGEILLSDSPLLLYPAAFSSSPASSFCSLCFRSLLSVRIPCPSCPSSAFCSVRCLSTALCSSHGPSICRALAALPPVHDPELRAQCYFLLAAYALSLTSPDNFYLLLSLDGGDAASAHPEAIALHALIAPVTGFSLEVTTSLIAKDKRNAFGLMEPFRLEDGGERRVRAYGIYPSASFFNHDCLPNACRFDYLDRDGDDNSKITVRAIFDIPKGREVCLSYFPVNWGYKERQERLMEDYGFQCNCDRCEVEKNWKDEEEEGMDDDNDEVGEMEDSEENENVDFPHAYFFVRYVCDQEDCGGTIAPLPPSPKGTLSDVMECNVCGQLKKEEGFGGHGSDSEFGAMID
ncbi:hypothetical protein HPP92_003450 [Vanilla planifolia]|uniref:SET domain-containing protein n=1 Tax=Vanilla planifolia TaxID=51239 RepID=A0A835VFG8_VANPL|nr:hypothetical protein HPP92_003450 [Vanilla planifolia]